MRELLFVIVDVQGDEVILNEPVNAPVGKLWHDGSAWSFMWNTDREGDGYGAVLARDGYLDAFVRNANGNMCIVDVSDRDILVPGNLLYTGKRGMMGIIGLTDHAVLTSLFDKASQILKSYGKRT